jgi:hypothetical protein
VISDPGDASGIVRADMNAHAARSMGGAQIPSAACCASGQVTAPPKKKLLRGAKNRIAKSAFCLADWRKRAAMHKIKKQSGGKTTSGRSDR